MKQINWFDCSALIFELDFLCPLGKKKNFLIIPQINTR